PTFLFLPRSLCSVVFVSEKLHRACDFLRLWRPARPFAVYFLIVTPIAVRRIRNRTESVMVAQSGPVYLMILMMLALPGRGRPGLRGLQFPGRGRPGLRERRPGLREFRRRTPSSAARRRKRRGVEMRLR